MSSHSTSITVASWRTALPPLAGDIVTLREPVPEDSAAISALLSLADATHFGVDDFTHEADARRAIDAAARDRAAGTSFTYIVTLTSAQTIVGLIQVRRLDPTFEGAEWEFTLAPSARGTGIFLDAARAVIGFAFSVAGVHRLEARALVDNGRANGALRKLGAVHEGILRRAVRRGPVHCDQALWALLKDDWAHRQLPDAPSVH